MGHSQVRSRQRAVLSLEYSDAEVVLDPEPALQPNEEVLLFGRHQFSQKRGNSHHRHSNQSHLRKSAYSLLMTIAV